MSDFDVCACGDYRHQHDARGCLICRAGRAPWDNCSGFRLFKEADPDDPNVKQAAAPIDEVEGRVRMCKEP